ncbi:MAG: TIGR02587 family membrane protein [Burkholderiales bacterium]|nr:TIGR02587 family membrane protein [Burkholderiales bacterium]
MAHAAAHEHSSSRHFAVGLARAYAGAAIFSLPLLMTMEMWSLGFTMQPARQALFLVLFFPFLVVLSWHAGFEETFSWRDDVLDALVALAVGFTSAAAVLFVLGILGRGTPLRDAVGTIVLQAVPASVGALLAQSMLGLRHPAQASSGPGSRYASELFIMAVGAVFLGFNLAPTEEILLLALRAGEAQALGVMLLSIALMHAFVYSVEFHSRAPGTATEDSVASVFLRFTIAGYAIVLLLCAYILWSFGRLDGLSALESLKTVTILGFPAAIGAASARLIL